MDCWACIMISIMGMCAEMYAVGYSISRVTQDDYARESYRRGLTHSCSFEINMVCLNISSTTFKLSEVLCDYDFLEKMIKTFFLVLKVFHGIKTRCENG